MRVFFREELQAITKLLEELKALFIASMHGGSLKAYKNQARGSKKIISISPQAHQAYAQERLPQVYTPNLIRFRLPKRKPHLLRRKHGTYS
jgi:hypothetical protein